MKDTMYNKYYEKLIEVAIRMNAQAKEKDLLRNRTNYGSVSTLSQILRDMGHEVDACVYEDGNYLISAKIIVDGETKINFED